jgi:DNA-directed RNA polymerase specialized sigma24 family protein
MSTSRRPSFADVAAISAGDPAALEDVFGRLWPEVYAFVRMNTAEWLGRKESHADLAQSACREVLEDLRARPKSFANEAEFRSWLFTAA